jgi:hypothetical protein
MSLNVFCSCPRTAISLQWCARSADSQEKVSSYYLRQVSHYRFIPTVCSPVAHQLPDPPQPFVLRISLDGSPFGLLILVTLYGPTNIGDEKGHHPQPHMGGRHKYQVVLLGAPRGLLKALARFHPSASQPSTRCLTPWLMWTSALFTIFSYATPRHL